MPLGPSPCGVRCVSLGCKLLGMTQTQTFVLLLALLAAGVVLYAFGIEAPGALCIGAAIGGAAPVSLGAAKGGGD